MKRQRVASSTSSTRVKATKALAKRKPVNFSIPRGPTVTGFPKQLQVKHRYYERVRLNALLGVLTINNFRANGMFDPYATGVGHQPLYFDQLSAVYNHFTVIRSKITAKFIQQTDAAGCAGSICGIYVDDDTSTLASISDIVEQNSSVFKTALPSGENQAIVSQTWDAVQTFGPNPLANDNLQGTPGTDPTEQSIFCVYFQPMAAANTTGELEVFIEYTAIWDELKNVAGS